MKRTLLMTFCCCISIWATAQTKVVSGTVTASDDGQPMIGVSVVVQGTSKGTVTDVDGKYELSLVPGENNLMFSYIGYLSQTVAVGDRSAIDIVMNQDVKTLNDIVVVGYGTQKKSDLTGSVSSVRKEDITKIPNPNAVQALQGKASGVQVTTPSGEPGAVPVVRVRGVGTFNNASPIYVVDGVILNDISFLNSADIETLEVLKDASSTAIYGSRGANGVIIITTKQGKLGQGKPVVTFSAEYDLQHLSKQINLLSGSEFGSYVNDFAPGTYNNLDILPNTNWQSLIFNDAPMTNIETSVSGASERSSYYLGIGYFGQQGIIDSSSYNRLSVKLNNTFKVSNAVKVGDNITFAPFTQRFSPNVTYSAYRAQPTITPYNPDGTYSEVPGVGNPLADIQYSNSFARGMRMVGNIYTDVTFLKSFTFRTSFGTDLDYQQAKSYTPVFYVSPQQQNEINDLFVGQSTNVLWLWENTLNYQRAFGKSNVDALAGYTMQEESSQFLNGSAENILGDAKNLWYLNPDNVLPSSISNGVDPEHNFSMISYLFRVNYTYDEKYLLTATFRADGSSKFAAGNRWGYFPSFAAGWNISRENFMQGVTAISNLKLRASWGQIGNEKINYLDQYALVENQINAVLGTAEVLVPGSSYGKTGNPNLTWETTTQTDIGLEIGFLKNRLTSEFDFYSRTTDDILVELTTPGYVGNGEGVKVRYNAGSVLNRGLDFDVAWTDDIHDFHYRVGVLGSTIHNEVLSVGGNSGVDSTLVGGELGNGQTVTLSEEGYPIGSFYGYEIGGVFQNQQQLDSYPHESLAQVGDLIYVDQNGDGKLNASDRVHIGSPIPTLIYGFSLEGGWKGLSLSLDFQGQSGNDIYNGKEAVRPDLYNFEHHVVNRWTGEGTSNTEPRATSGGVNWLPSTRFIYDGSFLRLRTILLSYNLPKKFATKMWMTQASVFLRGTNVFTTTKWTGYTPEIGGPDVLSNGIDYGVYPITAIYSIGLNATF